MRVESKATALDDLLSEVVDRRGVTPLKLDSDFTNQGHRVISAKVVRDGRIDLTADEPRFVDDETYTRWMKGPILADDVIMTSEAPVGEVAYVAEAREWCLGQRLFGLRTKKDRMQGRFLYYALRSEAVRHDLLSRATGTTAQGIRQTELLKVLVPEPPLNVQVAIAHILGTLDDKIELNRRMNETLDAIARAIFKSWFVDFDAVRAKASGEPPESICRRLGLTSELLVLFPDRLVDSELGEIPDGWRVQPLSQMAERISKGTTPTKQDIAGATDTPSVPFIKVKDINDRGEIIRDGLELIPESVHKGALKRSILEAGDILFSIAGTIGRVAVVEPDLANSNTNQAVAFVRLKDKSAHLGLCQQHLLSDRIQESASASIVQAVQANVSLASLGALEIVVPQGDVLELWNQIFGGLFNKKSICAAESRTLAAVRDALLPKLLSGELRVSLEGAA